MTITRDAIPAIPREASTSSGPAHPRAIMAVILVSYFMILLDNSIIFTGLPTIGAAMHYSATGLSWVQDAYTLVFGGLLLLGARLGDLLGRRRVFVAGLAVSATAGHGHGHPGAALAGRVSAALTGGSVLLALCLVATVVLIVPGGRPGSAETRRSRAIAGRSA